MVDGLDRTAVDGAYNVPYAIPHIEVDYVLSDAGVPVGYWRSVGNSQNGFVVESVGDDGAPRVHRVVCAVDCGMTVNPDTIEAQMESGVAFGLTGALMGPITFEKGRVVESNFDSYPMLRMSEMPVVEVHIVSSTEPPGGIGEPGVPPVAPAVANALFAATGKRVRSLPITAETLKG